MAQCGWCERDPLLPRWLSPDPSRSRRSPRQPKSFSPGQVGSRRQGRIESSSRAWRNAEGQGHVQGTYPGFAGVRYDDEFMVSRVLVDIAVDRTDQGGFTADLKQPVGTDFRYRSHRSWTASRGRNSQALSRTLRSSSIRRGRDEILSRVAGLRRVGSQAPAWQCENPYAG